MLPAAELALTKLQIVALNAKDRGDLYALLLACEVAERPSREPAEQATLRRPAAST